MRYNWQSYILGVIAMAFCETSISKCFMKISDSREEVKIQHSLLDILTIVLCAVIGGSEDFYDIEEFAKCKEDFFRTFLDLPNGMPSHDTINRVISRLDPKEFSNCIVEWTKLLSEKHEGVIAIDGKTLRRSYRDASKKNPLHVVGAWSSDNGIVLGQVQTDAKSNEITVIPELLKLLDIEGSIVTIDAMGCQTDIARRILSGGGDYVLALKGNQKNSLDSVEHLFGWELKNDFGGVFHTETLSIEKDHGRTETRKVCSIGELEKIEGLDVEKWPGLQSLTMVESIREITGSSTIEHRYYISSLAADAKVIGESIRAHWGIENSLHWVMDVTFHEDYARNRKDNSAANMSTMRHFALNLIKQEKNTKGSIKGKRKRAGWNDDYLLKLIGLI
jgi:predicted transposase YbfD/YdcC